MEVQIQTLSKFRRTGIVISQGNDCDCLYFGNLKSLPVSACGKKGGVKLNKLVDYLTGDFLEEQYRGQRDLAGKISTLDKMMESHGPLGEFLFDKKLLKGEPL